MNALMQRSGSATETHALPPLSLGGLDLAPQVSAGGKPESYHPQYLRLFGPIPAASAIVPVSQSPLSDTDGNLGPSSALCDPTQAAGHPLCASSTAIAHPELYQLLAATGHPSTAALSSIAALRLRHVAKGHHPAADAAHGPVWWMRGVREWWERALAARNPDNRRKALIAAASLLVAMIDAEDFTRSQQEPTP